MGQTMSRRVTANLKEEESCADGGTCGTANLKWCTYNENCGQPATRTACHIGTLGPPRCEEHACGACPKIAPPVTPQPAPQAPLAPPQVAGYRYCFYESDICKNCGEEFGEHLAKFPHPFRRTIRRSILRLGGEVPKCEAFVFSHKTESGREKK
jgi:hypothetical protein